MTEKEKVKEISKRSKFRESFLTWETEITAAIAASDREEIEILIQLFDTKEKKLNDLNEKIGDLITEVDDYVTDQDESEKFAERMLRVKLKAQNYLKSKTVPLNPSNPAGPKMKLSRLPEIVVKPFDGKLEEWVPFWDSFSSAVHDREDLTPVDKFNYLKGYLMGEARRAIGGFTLTESNYAEAVDVLKERFGDVRATERALLAKLMNFKVIDHGWKLEKLSEFCDEVDSTVRSLKQLGTDPGKYQAILMPFLSSRLPTEYVLLWSRREQGDSDDVLELIKMVRSEVKHRQRANLLKQEFDRSKSSKGENSGKSGNEGRTGNSFQKGFQKEHKTSLYAGTTHTHVNKNNTTSCVFCGAEHESYKCDTVKTICVKDREEMVKKSRCCFNCLRPGHRAQDCATKILCRNCKTKHNTLLCRRQEEVHEDPPGNEHDKAIKVKKVNVQSECEYSNESILMTLQACVSGADGAERPVRIFVDPGSERSFITEKLMSSYGLRELGVENVTIEAFKGTVVSSGPLVVGEVLLKAVPKENQNRASLKIRGLVVPSICKPINKIPKGPWLDELRTKGVIPGDNIGGADHETEPIDVLIGGDYYPELMSDQIIRTTSGPIALKSHFGWALLGPTVKTSDKQSIATVMFLKTCENEDSPEICVKRLWSLEAMGVTPTEVNVKEKENATKIIKEFEDSIVKLDNSYSVKLPKVDPEVRVQENKWQAERRLGSLMGKLKKDHELLGRYHQEVQNLLDSGYASKISDSSEYPSFYIPHRAVIKEERETTKLRIVFDGSAKDRQNVALNSCFESGPNLNPELLQLLVRFRLHDIVLLGDIKKAFLQVRLSEEDKGFCKFLWYNNPFRDESPVVFQMNRVLFGLNCSPFLLAATLKFHCKQYQGAYPETVKSLLSDLYVDDWVTGGESVEEVITKYHQGKQILAEGGFELHKWKSNSNPVLKQVKRESGEQIDNSEVLLCDSTKILGLEWSAGEDELQFNFGPFVNLMESVDRVTKRKVLSIGSGIFDPLGLISPISLQYKLLIRALWQQGLDWDDPIPEEFVTVWEKLKTEMKMCVQISFSRLVTVTKNATCMQLHVFTDASSKAYATAIYLKSDSGQQVNVSLLAAKSRVAPVHAISIPRLELMGALLGVRLLNYVKRSSPYLRDIKTYFWCDSEVALCWIRKPAETWKTFIQNRVSEIHSGSDPGSWRFCPGVDNPADIPSRGAFPNQLKSSVLWREGPDWLKNESSWPENKRKDVNDALGEKRPQRNIVVKANICILPKKRIGDYGKLIRLTAWIVKFIDWLGVKARNKRGVNGLEVPSALLTNSEMSRARHYWWRVVQVEQFEPELSSLGEGKSVSSDSSIRSLDPQLDGDLIKVKGRLQFSSLSENEKHPIIVRGNHWVVRAFILKCHEVVMHAGVNETLMEIRKSVWVVHGRREVQKLVRSCVTCMKLLKKPVEQVEAPLPPTRVNRADPFNVVGVDFFGPLYVNPKRHEDKVYGLIFTCAIVRAVHLELTASLRTEDFIMAFERFIGRRGKPSIVYSDNAKTFKCASKEIRESWDFSQEKVNNYFLSKNITWKFIVDRAPWWGGMWERLIRSVKTLLKKNFGKAYLSFDELRTVLVQIEAIINSRPITFVSVESSEPDPLTPNDMLLGGTASVVPALGVDTDLGACKSDLIRRVKYKKLMVKQFWKRWNHEYLNELRKTNEIIRVQKAFPKVGQVVLIVEDNVPRPLSKLGLIVELHSGIDGIVRAVTLRTKGGLIKRPVQRLVMLEIEACESLKSVSQSSSLAPHDPPPAAVSEGGEDVAEHVDELSPVSSRTRTRRVNLPAYLRDYTA